MRLKTLSLAAAALLLSAGAASAEVVMRDLHLRSGPGTNYHVIDTMPAGAQVAVLDCGGAWCRVNWRGEQGFASRRYLGSGSYVYRRYYYEPGYSWGPFWGFGFGGGAYYGHRYYNHRYYGGGGGRHWRGGGGGGHHGGTIGSGSAIGGGGGGGGSSGGGGLIGSH